MAEKCHPVKVEININIEYFLAVLDVKMSLFTWCWEVLMGVCVLDLAVQVCDIISCWVITWHICSLFAEASWHRCFLLMTGFKVKAKPLAFLLKWLYSCTDIEWHYMITWIYFWNHWEHLKALVTSSFCLQTSGNVPPTLTVNLHLSAAP